MTNDSIPLWRRCSSFFAHCIVALWPIESKDWARALAGELHEIEAPLAALHWLLGGLMLLSRERFKFFLRSLTRPLGVAPESPSALLPANPGPAPRLPRLVTALSLGASLALLALPEVRASLSSVLISDSRVKWDIQKLQKQVQANHDPQLLAFLSLLSDDNNERAQLAEEAIRRDPSLLWVDYIESYWQFVSADRRHFLSDEKIARLQASEPQNAVTLMLGAEILSHPVQVAYYSSRRKGVPSEDPSWELEIAKNPAWLAAMDRAFGATYVDNYWSRQIDLIRLISNRYHVSDPDLTLTAIRRQNFFDFQDIHAYTRFLLTRGDEFARNGDTHAAAADYQTIELFARKLSSKKSSGYGDWEAAHIGMTAERHLAALYTSTGHPAEAQLATTQLAVWEKSNADMNARWAGRFSSIRPRPWSIHEQAGLLINLFAVSISVLFPITILVLLGVGGATSLTRRLLGRFYRVFSIVADAGPVFLAVSFAGLFFAYHPYTKFYSGADPLNANLKDIPDFYAFVGVTHNLPGPVARFLYETLRIHSDYLYWLIFTIALSVLALFFVFRLVRPRRSPLPQ